jgi:hypothetical protein
MEKTISQIMSEEHKKLNELLKQLENNHCRKSSSLMKMTYGISMTLSIKEQKSISLRKS